MLSETTLGFLLMSASLIVMFLLYYRYREKSVKEGRKQAAATEQAVQRGREAASDLDEQKRLQKLAHGSQIGVARGRLTASERHTIRRVADE